jgi:hypothetical protein
VEVGEMIGNKMEVYLVTLYNAECDEECVSAVVVAENKHEAKIAAIEECSFNVEERRTECVLIRDECPCVYWMG